MKKSILFSIVIFFQFAFSVSSIPGAFVDVGYSAKSISMGLVQSNLDHGAMGTILNPANLLNNTEKHSIAMNSFKLRNLDNFLVLA